jgi:hypothetical protein
MWAFVTLKISEHSAAVARLIHKTVLKMEVVGIDTLRVAAQVTGFDLGAVIVSDVLTELRARHDSMSEILDTVNFDLYMFPTIRLQVREPTTFATGDR